MNNLLQSNLKALESNLNTLTDSITSYNPSPTAAHSLIAADDELSSSLQLLVKHQRNYAETLRLREETHALDERIKEVIKNLADAWKQLRSVALTQGKDSKQTADRKVDPATLLSYAQHLAKFTKPVKTKSIDPGAEPEESGRSPLPGKQASSRLSPEELAWLSPERGIAQAFAPWPDEATIRGGALGRIQAAVIEGGRDPEELARESGLTAKDEVATKAEDFEDGRDEPPPFTRRETVLAAPQQNAGPRRREEKQESMFEGFDLYDPDADE